MIPELMAAIGSRTLRAFRKPLSFIIAIIMAIGIAAFAVSESTTEALLQPPNIPHVEQVVNLYSRRPPADLFSRDEAEYLTAHLVLVREVTSWHPFSASLKDNRGSRVVAGEMVSANYFSLLGGSAAAGRVLLPSDNSVSSTLVAVVRSGWWASVFGPDQSPVGQTLVLNNHPVVVVGVLPDSFRGTNIPNLAPTQVWLPLSADGVITQLDASADSQLGSVHLKARLRDGHSIEALRAELWQISGALDSENPLPSTRYTAVNKRSFLARYASEIRLFENVDPLVMPAATLLRIVILIAMLAACSNLANLVLARSLTRRGESATRLALGASRVDLIRDMTLDAAIPAIAGAGLGIVVAVWAIRLINSAVRLPLGLVAVLNVAIDVRVLAAATCVTVGAVIVCGLYPAVVASRSRNLTADGIGGHHKKRTAWGIIVAQTCFGVTMLSLTGLFISQIQRSQDRNHLALSHIALVQIDADSQAVSPDQFDADLKSITARLHQTINMKAALVSQLPTVGGLVPIRLKALPDEQERTFSARLVGLGPDACEALRLVLFRGRAADLERIGDLPVVAISRGLALAAFGTDDVLGRQVFVDVGFDSKEQQRSHYELRTIVGVMEDMVGSGKIPTNNIYMPLAQLGTKRQVDIVSRVDGDADDAAGTIARVTAEVDPALTVVSQGNAASVSGDSATILIVIADIAGVVGAVTMAIVFIGLYGLLSYSVERERREIGVRMALGATRLMVCRRILVKGAARLTAGTTAGWILALAVQRLMNSLFVGILPTPGWSLVFLICVAVWVLGLAACLVPSIRAATLNPARILNSQ